MENNIKKLKVVNVVNKDLYTYIIDLQENVEVFGEEEAMPLIYQHRITIGDYDQENQKMIKSDNEAQKRKDIKDFFGVEFEDVDTLQDQEFEFFVKDNKVSRKEQVELSSMDDLVKDDLLDELTIVKINEESYGTIFIVVSDGTNNYKLSGFEVRGFRQDKSTFINAKKLNSTLKNKNYFFPDGDLQSYIGAKVIATVGEFNGYKFLKPNKIIKE